MTTTNNLGLTHISQAQSQKEVTANANFDRIDAILNRGAVDKDIATPPGSPAEGDLYIVAGSPTGAWAGRAGDLAYYLNAAWAFIDPKEGMTLWLCDEDALYTFDGAAWVSAGSNIQNAALIGINATADVINRLAVASEAILFNNDGAGVQVKVNKELATDTASFLFQTGLDGRAEIGTVGSDDFVFKTSPDGSVFTTALTLDKDTADFTVGQMLGFTAASELTIATDAITVTQTCHRIDTEADAASDNLATINGGVAEQILILRAENDARTVVVKHGSGNLALAGAADFSLDDGHDRIVLQKYGAGWVELMRSTNG